MKEITVTYTLEVTEILRGVDDAAEEIVIDPDYGIHQKTVAENALEAESVNLSNYKVFVRDVEEQECSACSIPQE